MTEKFHIGVLILILLALDYAALNDILKVNEPDVVGDTRHSHSVQLCLP